MKPSKPKMRSSLAVTRADVDTRYIEFSTDPETAQKIKDFGVLTRPYGGNIYHLIVDGRYSFNDVWEYIESLGEPFSDGKRDLFDRR